MIQIEYYYVSSLMRYKYLSYEMVLIDECGLQKNLNILIFWIEWLNFNILKSMFGIFENLKNNIRKHFRYASALET